MKYIYAFESKDDFEKYEAVTDRFAEKLDGYKEMLQNDYQLNELPRAVVWTSGEMATTVFSRLPIPAFTSRDIIYMTPDIEEWRQLMLEQLEGKNLPHIRKFYESYSENDVMTILAHELTHHIDLFPDDFDDDRTDGIWFEEGMCEYLPRRMLLGNEEYEAILNIETELIDAFTVEYGESSLENFGTSSYQGSLPSIMFDYWRSFVLVHHLVNDRFDGEILEVFEAYNHWYNTNGETSLMKFFQIDDKDLLKK